MHHINYPLLVHRLHLVTRNTPQIVNQIHIAHIVYLARSQMAGGDENACNHSRVVNKQTKQQDEPTSQTLHRISGLFACIHDTSDVVILALSVNSTN